MSISTVGDATKCEADSLRWVLRAQGLRRKQPSLGILQRRHHRGQAVKVLLVYFGTHCLCVHVLNCTTMDVVYPASPMMLYTNPELLRLLLVPVLQRGARAGRKLHSRKEVCVCEKMRQIHSKMLQRSFCSY